MSTRRQPPPASILGAGAGAVVGEQTGREAVDFGLELAAEVKSEV